MRVGVTLPQFRHDAEAAIAVARRAEAVGIDGVFVFDHLWPLGQRMRPALHSLTLLGALAAETETVSMGPLVARARGGARGGRPGRGGGRGAPGGGGPRGGAPPPPRFSCTPSSRCTGCSGGGSSPRSAPATR